MKGIDPPNAIAGNILFAGFSIAMLVFVGWLWLSATRLGFKMSFYDESGGLCWLWFLVGNGGGLLLLGGGAYLWFALIKAMRITIEVGPHGLCIVESGSPLVLLWDQIVSVNEVELVSRPGRGIAGAAISAMDSNVTTWEIFRADGEMFLAGNELMRLVRRNLPPGVKRAKEQRIV